MIQKVILKIYSLGEALLKLKRYEEAIVCYDEAIKINPKLINVLSNKGNV